MFYQDGPIDNFTHVPGPVAQSSSDIDYNAAFTVWMTIAHFSIINNKFLNRDPYVVPEQPPLVILDIKSCVCMDKNSNDTKHTRQISRIMHFVRNDKEYNLHKKVWCEGGM